MNVWIAGNHLTKEETNQRASANMETSSAEAALLSSGLHKLIVTQWNRWAETIRIDTAQTQKRSFCLEPERRHSLFLPGVSCFISLFCSLRQIKQVCKLFNESWSIESIDNELPSCRRFEVFLFSVVENCKSSVWDDGAFKLQQV